MTYTEMTIDGGNEIRYIKLASMPIIYYLVAIVILAVAFAWKKKWDVSLLIAYMFLIFSYTILKRTPGEELRYGMEPFWSYKAVFAGGFSPVSRKTLFIQILANVIMYVPVGFLAGRQIGWKSIVMGFGYSLFIELIQLLTGRGLFEFDDILHNSVGAAIGFGILILLQRVKEKCRLRNYGNR